jgi:hypothetical protein
LPNPDDTAAPHSAPHPRLQPSLLNQADTSSQSAPNGDHGQLRMLDGLEAVVRPRAAVHASRLRSRVVVLLGAGVALAAAAWWWNQPGSAEQEPPPKSLALGAAATQPSQVVAASTSPLRAAAPATRTPQTDQSVSADAAAAPARIETLAVAATPTAPTAEPAVRPEPVDASAAITAPIVAVTAVTKLEPEAEPKSEPQKANAVVTPPHKPAATVADHAHPVKTRAASALPTPADKTRAGPSSSMTRADTAKGPKVDDADVLLLTALLAHVSRKDANATLLEQDQLTIAQLVKRCDTRTAEETRECRRRICEGYWGKAEACPAPANPKKS